MHAGCLPAWTTAAGRPQCDSWVGEHAYRPYMLAAPKCVRRHTVLSRQCWFQKKTRLVHLSTATITLLNLMPRTSISGKPTMKPRLIESEGCLGRYTCCMRSLGFNSFKLYFCPSDIRPSFFFSMPISVLFSSCVSFVAFSALFIYIRS